VEYPSLPKPSLTLKMVLMQALLDELKAHLKKVRTAE
jgi:hypothetical protein